MHTRLEYDSLGSIEVPASRLWGASTQRSLQYFAISRERFPAELVYALILVKRSAAMANCRLGLLPPDVTEGIRRAADEVLAGEHQEEFPVSVWQTGSGTQLNMNANEVLANRASELLGGPRGRGRLVHPNDHVNRSQSSNDVIPTAMHIAAARCIAERLLPALRTLAATLDEQCRRFSDIVKIGRTHLQDATPLTLGQEFSGYAEQLHRARAAIEGTLPELHELALGGTAVGTGLNAPATFATQAIDEIAHAIGLPFIEARNRFAALAAHDALLRMHGGLQALAAALSKIANDVRWLASGPRAGLGELRLPENEPGSSIMPGKVNPTQSEAMLMLCAQVTGNQTIMAIAGAGGNFELNVYKPLIAHATLQSIRLLADGMRSFNDHCISGIEPDRARIDDLLQRSLMLVTALTPHIGYDRAAEIAKKAHGEGSTLREAALALGYVSADQFDQWVRPERMI
ncbi:MAG: class II fumarate hydratase [Burkholderiales bacterium]|nr:class II fumarate hydratase [Burkholderiales bacterium]